MTVGIFTVDARLVVQTWDPWMAEATGIPADAALGRPLADVVPDLEARGVLAHLRSVLEHGTVEVLAPALHHYLIACPPRTPSGRFDRMQQHVTIGPLRREAAIAGVVVTVQDVTARIESERALAGSIDAMAGTLGDPQWTNRQRNVRQLASHGQAIVETLVDTLRTQHRNFSVLSSALDLLAMADLDVVDPVIACLDDQDPDLRVQAALILGRHSDPRAVPALMRALSDPDLNVRFHAIEALGTLQATPAVDALIRIAETREFFLAFPAIQALARLGDADTARRLLPLLGDELIGPAAVDVLGELGDDDVAAPLAELLGEPQAPVEAIAEALSSLFDRYERRYGAGDQIATIVRRTATPAAVQQLVDAATRAASDRLRGIARVLGWLEGPSVERALARLLGQPSVRAQIVEALVRFGAGVVDLLIEQLGGGDVETRQAAAVALGRIGDHRATTSLVAALDDSALTVPAAAALARIGDSAAFDALMARIGDPDPAVRQAVIAALNSIGHPDMPRRVLALMADS
ncbi:MAG TPA: HEAT repeat domain-containing protein, partial [Caldimonas sp.]|nr:HEAT repeat domain-containing protein [Caldimonas sp.]